MNAMLRPATKRPQRAVATTSGLTEMQADFVRKYVGGLSQTEAARLAGYSQPNVDGYRLLRQQSVIEAVNRETERVLMTEGQQAALAFMIKAPGNEKLPGAVRFQASKWLMEKAGHGLAAQRAALGLPANDKPLSEMSLAELDTFLHAGITALEHVKAQEQRTIEGSARNIEHDGVGCDAQVIDA